MRLQVLSWGFCGDPEDFIYTRWGWLLCFTEQIGNLSADLWEKKYWIKILIKEDKMWDRFSDCRIIITSTCAMAIYM